MSELARRSRWCDQSILDERNSARSSGPLRGRLSVWNSRRGNHLGQRSCGSAQTDPMRASGGEFIASAGEQPLEVRAMTQASSLSPPIPLDYENTLVLAIELSKTKWVLAAQEPMRMSAGASGSGKIWWLTGSAWSIVLAPCWRPWGWVTTTPSGGIGAHALRPCERRSEIRFRRMPTPGYF